MHFIRSALVRVRVSVRVSAGVSVRRSVSVRVATRFKVISVRVMFRFRVIIFPYKQYIHLGKNKPRLALVMS